MAPAVLIRWLVDFVPCIESSKVRREWGVYLINTIKKPFKGLTAEVATID